MVERFILRMDPRNIFNFFKEGVQFKCVTVLNFEMGLFT